MRDSVALEHGICHCFGSTAKHHVEQASTEGTTLPEPPRSEIIQYFGPRSASTLVVRSELLMFQWAPA